MRLYKTAVAELRVGCCAECPAHNRVTVKRRVEERGRLKWVTEPVHVLCKKTGKKVLLTTIDCDCPLPYEEATVDSCLRRNDEGVRLGGVNG